MGVYVRKQADHGEGNKTAHCSRIIITRQASVCGLEVLWYVVMASMCRQTRSTSVMILVHSQEGWLIANVRYLLIMQVVEPSHESSRSTERADEPRLVMRDEEAVLPDTAFKRLGSIVLQGTDRVRVGVDVRALEWVLIAPCLVQELGLEEADKASVAAIEAVGGLVVLEEVEPVLASVLIFLHVALVFHAVSDLRDAEVVVTVFESPREGSSHCTYRQRPGQLKSNLHDAA